VHRTDRTLPLPDEMQGQWVDADDPNSKLNIECGEVTCFGTVVEYDHKLIGHEDGAIIISLRGEGELREDEFQSSNITELVITPEGHFHAFNVSFSIHFVRENEN